ncbi:MAG: hypothetical protein CHACPFDD_01433 [Phycisphaerae bacterium]|nr:hypothetical protein [Phycisphaerae bacterium]
MSDIPRRRAWRGWSGRSAGAVAASLLALLGGCPQNVQSLLSIDPLTAQKLATSSEPSDFAGLLPPDALQVFSVDVPAGSELAVAIRSAVGDALHIAYVEAPDGARFDGLDGLISDDTHTFADVEQSADGTVLRFRASAKTGGTWRIALRGQPRDEIETLMRQSRRRSVVENAFLLGYLLSSLSDPESIDQPVTDLLYQVFPNYGSARRSLDFVIRVAVTEPGEEQELEVPALPPAPPQPGDTSGDAGNDNASDNANDNAGGASNENGNDNADDGSNDNSADNGNDSTDGNDNGSDDSPPPSSVALTRVVRSGDAVPDQPGGTTFTYFSAPTMSADGRVAFWGGYAGGHGHGGLYAWDGAALRRVVDDDPARAGSVPGGNPGEFFGDFVIPVGGDAATVLWEAGGNLLFVGRSRGDGAFRGIYRWRASDGGVSRVLDMRQLAGQYPDVLSGDTGPVFVAEFFTPGVSDAGVITAMAKYSYVTTDRGFALGTAVFTSDGTTITRIVDEIIGAPGNVPDQGSGAFFDDIGGVLTTNAQGHTLFQGSYTGGQGRRGVYLNIGAAATRVIDTATGRTYPGLPSDAKLGLGSTAFTAMSISDPGHIAIDTVLTTGGVPHDTVVYWNGSTWQELKRGDGVVADVLLTGLDQSGRCVLLAGGRPILAGPTGDTKELAATSPAELGGRAPTWLSGGAINNHGRVLLRFTTPGADQSALGGLALWTGEKLLIAADLVASVPSAGGSILTLALPETDRPGRSGALNDDDEFAFRVQEPGADAKSGTADDVQAVYVGRGE